MVYTFHPIVILQVAGAGGNFVDPEKLIDGVRELGASLEAVARQYAARASSERKIRADDNVSRALSGELGRCDCEHVGTATGAISEEQDVGVTSGRDLTGTEVFDADSHAGPFLQGHRDGGLPDRQPRGFTCLALQAIASLRSHHLVQMFIPIDQ